MIDKSILDGIIVGRVDPHIYAFTTRTVPNYLKVGDTYRPVSERLQEWRKYFPQLQKEFEGKAKVSDSVYFRDFSVHEFLEREKHRERLLPTDISEDIYYSREFFKEATAQDVQEAIADILKDYNAHTQVYQFYNAQDRLPEKTRYASTGTWDMRPNQEKTVENFKIALDNGRKNLLMYAVMRFGKSFTSMCCAVVMNAKLVVVVSAKADVKTEWKKTVQSADNFAEYEFYTSDDLKENNKIITERLTEDKKSVLFLTLQDLQGDEIKEKHQELFGEEIDLLIIDETHFGARAEKYGEVLRTKKKNGEIEKNYETEEETIEQAEEHSKALNAKVRLHLSGTPYRILMGSEFEKDDIIAFYQFTDIVNDQKKWDEENFALPEEEKREDWENPYFGFPQMIRFAFNPNESARAKLKELSNGGTSYNFSALFKPKSIKKADDESHKKFENEQEILDLLEVIDGSKDDDELLGFLDYDKIQDGKMCRHIVIVLPYCAACDALEELIKTNATRFKNLNGYEIVNISGVDRPNEYRTPEEIKAKIQNCEKDGKKTITLTVNRMLTGSTVEEWDTMLFLKDTASPQEYDQAVFRLQNQYVKTYTDKNGEAIKYNMKPQTLLVDFDPQRMFVMQEQKSQVYVLNAGESGNAKACERLEEELRISPIITLNKDKMVQVVPTDIMQAVSHYSANKGVADEVREIPVDLDLLSIEEIRCVIERENELGDKAGLTIKAHEGEETDLDTDGEETGGTSTENGGNSTNGDSSGTTQSGSDEENENKKDPVKQFRTYYSRILFFAFLTKNTVGSLSEIVACIDEPENARIAHNLGIRKNVLSAMQRMYWGALQKLDYKIQNINKLSHDESVDPVRRCIVAINKFGKLGVSEVITPDNICKDMVDLIPDDGLKSIIDGNNKILDIASKAGEFAIALCKKLQTLAYELPSIKDSIYAIPTSTITYEFTRKIYEVLGLNVENIAEQFNAYDLLEVKADNDEIDYEKVCGILTQKKPFNTITLNDEISEGEEKVKFEAVVGNPPYQENDGGGGQGASSSTLYDKFVYLSDKLRIKYLSMIIKANWTVGGKALNKFRQKMLNDKSIKYFIDYTNADMCFEGVQFPGGVCYFLKEDGYNNKCEITTITPKGITKSRRYLIEEGCDTYIRYSEAISVLEKVRNKKEKTFDTIVNSRNIFDLQTNFRGKETGEYTCYISSGKCFVDKNAFTFDESVNNYKVMVSYANGAAMANIPYSVISKPFIAKPKELCSDTYLVVGCYDEEFLANNVAKYMKTKIFRFLLSLKKSTPVAAKKTYSFIPLQDFTANSDIDWSKPIPEIDQQLYAKYNLTEEEISFIESMIKPME